jgi:epoxyqueuosine reductase QueG
MNSQLYKKITDEFHSICSSYRRDGIIGVTDLNSVNLLPVQKKYLTNKLLKLGTFKEISVLSFGLFYRDVEIEAIPNRWISSSDEIRSWNIYAYAYEELNKSLDDIAQHFAELTNGVWEQATYSGKVEHVNDYFPNCVSHRAFAEAAGLGWRGKSGLIVTPEKASAVRFATVFFPKIAGQPETKKENLQGCKSCQACLETCPVLRKGTGYRELCRLQINKLGLNSEVCGICIRVCWDVVKNRGKNKY